eukprot:CAMPEP_0117472420 /NCGR_PEP_ID=MMETSP0784-20121206/8238_1 /TAXON_ID=39447 /ORGANISM="" /LENGTH=67 /DNA_ID=CAMNT_0005266571 /DNA_START=178 /DNA_END=381 /DNA_ORIENTATION=+
MSLGSDEKVPSSIFDANSLAAAVFSQAQVVNAYSWPSSSEKQRFKPVRGFLPSSTPAKQLIVTPRKP